MTELANRLHKVDPDLRVVSGAAHRRGATRQEWLASTGVTCSECGREIFRSVDGMCPACYDKKYEFEIRDPGGVMSLLPESIIMAIARPARKNQT
jgi:hypothetical protein